MILVTGAAGHLGNVLLRALLTKGETVRALILPGEDISALKGLDVELTEGDICQPETLKQPFQDISVVYHLAGIVSILPGKEKLMREVNVQGTKNVIRAASNAGVRRLVYTSSIHALQRVPHGVIIDERIPFDPHNPAGEYDRSKAEASLNVLRAAQNGLETVIVCPTGVIGPHDYRRSEMGLFIRDLMRNKINFLINGFFDFVDVRDIAQGQISACNQGGSGEVYILSGEHIHIKRISEIVHNHSGTKSLDIMVPFWLAHFCARFAPLVSRLTKIEPRFTQYSLETVRSNSVISNAKARCELGYAPRPIKETIADSVHWWQERDMSQYNK